MPLYEMVLITKCTDPKTTAQIMARLSINISKLGGNVRDVKILSDRLLAKELKSAVDRTTTLIGRYSHVMFDGSPLLMSEVAHSLKLDKHVLLVQTFNVKDFYSYAPEYTQPLESQIKTKTDRYSLAEKIALLKEENTL